MVMEDIFPAIAQSAKMEHAFNGTKMRTKNPKNLNWIQMKLDLNKIGLE